MKIKSSGSEHLAKDAQSQSGQQNLGELQPMSFLTREPETVQEKLLLSHNASSVNTQYEPSAIPLVDITERSNKMPRNSAILYRNVKPKSESSPHFMGLTKLEDGRVYWLGAWMRVVKDSSVLEINLIPRKEDEK